MSHLFKSFIEHTCTEKFIKINWKITKLYPICNSNLCIAICSSKNLFYKNRILVHTEEENISLSRCLENFLDWLEREISEKKKLTFALN